MSSTESTAANPLLSLPVELWYHIIDRHPRTGEICRPLSLVCRSFRDFFQPLVFRSIIITARPSTPRDFEERFAFLQTERILAAIKRCRIQVTSYAHPRPTFLNHQAFHRIFPQLEFISFAALGFGTDHLPVLAKLQKVKEVRVKDCSLIPYEVQEILKFEHTTPEYPPFRIRHLKISGSFKPMFLYWLLLTQPDQLQSLAVHDSHRSELAMKADPSSPVFLNLRSLTVDRAQIRNWKSLKYFLSRCPMIRIIRINNVPADLADLTTEALSIPTLRALYASANVDLITPFTTGTDILDHVHFGAATSYLTWRAIQVLQGNGQTIRSLSFAITDLDAGHDPIGLLMSFPNLKALELRFSNPKLKSEFIDYVYDLLESPADSLPSTLEYLAIRFSATDGLAWQETLEPLVMDHSWSINFPELRYLEVSERNGSVYKYDHVRGQALEEVKFWDDLVQHQLGF
ncbi:hypothetical protein BDN72DRAFT_844750 [Pluteus cervinus]|uniref:Uncharacterized protein n=1 Tax=Pluteus cervinus TaxID=181527 RepID=A0ACD3AMI5_9AGAR|nr:hypothetical protein BDN72DRAFT_844750 [Pluteus cervinus]